MSADRNTGKSFLVKTREKQGAAAFLHAGYQILFAMLTFLWFAAGSFQMVGAAAVLSVLILCVVFFYEWSAVQEKTWRRFVTAVYLLVPLLLFLIKAIRNTFLCFAGKAADFLSEYGVPDDLFHILSGGASVEIRTQNVDMLLFLLCGLGISLWGSAFFSWMQKKCPLLFFILMVCGIAVPFFFWGVRPEILSVLSCLIFCFFYFCPSFAAGSAAAVLVVALFAGCSLFGMSETGTFSSLQKKWNAWRYQENTSVLPDGDLKKASKTKRGGETALKVTLKKRNGYYLRGLIGTTYSNNRWGTDKNKNRTAQALFGNSEDMSALSGTEVYRKLLWLHDRDFYSNTLLYRAFSQQKQEEGKSQASLYPFSVKNAGADRKYLYLPYECATDASSFEGSGKAALDTKENLHAAGFFGAEEYSCMTTENAAGKLSIAKLQKKSGLTDSEKTNLETYSEYVNAACLFLNKETKTLISSVTGEAMQGNVSQTAVIGKVKSWLKKNITYSENPGSIPADSDFAHWFFEEEKKGYDVQYASAAVMLFRYYGVPARYVEGYLLTPEAAENAGDDGQVNITQKYAHAWPEIYMQDVGWIPVEVTPGYEDRMGTPYYVSAEEAESDGNSSGKTDSSSANKKDAQGQNRNGNPNKTQNQKENQDVNQHQDADQKEDQSPDQNQDQSSDQSANQNQNSGNDQTGNPASGKRGGRTGRFLLRILLPVLLILLLFVFFFRRKLHEIYWDHKEKKLMAEGKYAEAVELRFDILYNRVYGRKDGDSDNRLVTFEKKLRQDGAGVDTAALRKSFAIRQKAVYAPQGVTEQEAKRAASFFRAEYERRQKKK